MQWQVLLGVAKSAARSISRAVEDAMRGGGGAAGVRSTQPASWQWRAENRTASVAG